MCIRDSYRLLPYNLTISTLEPLSACDVDKFIEEYVEKSEAIKKQGLSFKDILHPELFKMCIRDSFYGNRKKEIQPFKRQTGSP